jgi:uncharacterized protein with FMN-binding domain
MGNNKALIGFTAVAIVGIGAAAVAFAMNANNSSTNDTDSTSQAATPTPTTTASGTTPTTSTNGTTPTASSTAGAASKYKNGTYNADGTYTSPAGKEDISVSVTLNGDTITSVTVTPKATDPMSKNWQQRFASGISSQIVGKKLDDISIGKVSGSSLTGTGFNQALQSVKNNARS